MSTSLVLRRAALGTFVAAAVCACAPTAPTKASSSAPAQAAAPAGAAAPAPAAVPAAWPAASRTFTADDLRRRVSGKVFDMPLEGGVSVRMDYRDNGYVYVNVYPSGASDTGRWHVEDSRVCSELRRFPSGCNEWRAVGDQLMLRRTNGQLVTLAAR